MTLYYNQQWMLVSGVGAQAGGITPGTFSDGMFIAAGSHATMSNGASNDYFLAIFAGAPLVIGQSYDALLNFGPFVLEQGVNTTVTVLGVSPVGVVVQAITPGSGSGVWNFETFLIGATDTANGEVICDFDTIGGTVTCFAMGTLIATPSGATAVDKLRPGELVLTASGEQVPIIWVGHRRFTLAARPDVAPIRFLAGSLRPNVPSRDLLVSPEHAMGLDGALVPARLLVNGSTILRDASIAEITYYHIELPRHALLLAEGAAAESWLDTGNRATFANAPVPTDLYGDFEPDLASDAWRTRACAPLVEGGPSLAIIRARIEGRAATQGIGSGAMQTVWLENTGRHSTVVPAGAPGLVRLASVSAKAPGDQRRLGAAITALTVNGVELALHDERLALGFHGLESTGTLGWTDGQALLDLGHAEIDRAVTIEVNVVAAEQDWAVAA
jgi:Hint domain